MYLSLTPSSTAKGPSNVAAKGENNELKKQVNQAVEQYFALVDTSRSES